MKPIHIPLFLFVSISLLACAKNVQDNKTPSTPQNFIVPSAISDATFELAQAKGNYVALHFLLKTECPICLRHTQEYAQLDQEQENITHVFLKPDSEEEIQKWASQIPADSSQPEIYRDVDAQLAKKYDIPFGYQFHGQTVHYPALVLLDPTGKEVFRYIGESTRDRYSTSDFTNKLKELKQS